MKKLTHWKRDGSARMVDVSGKKSTARRARAAGFVRMSPEVLRRLPGVSSQGKPWPKGDPLEVARIAGIQAAKQTASLIPLCHPLPLSHIDVLVRVAKDGIAIEATVATEAPTGVEMEALTAASVAALTIYDMCKAVDKSMTITDICLLEKTGGKSGPYRRGASGRDASGKKSSR